MVIKGTKKLKKRTLDLASIGQQVTCKSHLPIKDNDFWNSDVQMALKMGLIESVGKAQDFVSEEETVDRMAKCKNTFHRSLTMNEVPMEIRPGQIFSIKESQLNQADVRAAVSKGMIKVLEISGNDDYSEEEFDMSEDEQEDIEVEETKTELDNSQEKLVQPATKRDILDTNEEIRSPVNVVNSENQTPINVNETSEGKPTTGVVWNPTGKKVIQQMTGAVVSNGDKSNAVTKTADKSGVTEALHSKAFNNSEVETVRTITPEMIDSDEPISVDPDKDDPKGQTLIINPTKKKSFNEIPHTNAAPESSGEVSFVDDEEIARKIQEHPILKDVPQNNNEEIDFVG